MRSVEGEPWTKVRSECAAEQQKFACAKIKLEDLGTIMWFPSTFMVGWPQARVRLCTTRALEH
jgi:hypothetical protein